MHHQEIDLRDDSRLGLNLNINYMLQSKHQSVERDYTNFVDALSYFGGLKDFAEILVVLLYAKYLESSFEDDVKHKGCLISGKYG